MRSGDYSVSPGLNVSGRRCEACNPNLRENNFIPFHSKEQTSTSKRGSKKLQRSGHKRSKSPFRKSGGGRKQVTPGRASTKYSETAGSRLQESTPKRDIARFSPMRADDEGRLIEVFKHQIALERDAERQRQELSLCSDFNLMDLFKFFDVNCTGSISEHDLELGLREFRVSTSAKDIALFFRHFDVDCDKRLKFTEFIAALTPKQSEYSAVLHNRTP